MVIVRWRKRNGTQRDSAQGLTSRSVKGDTRAQDGFQSYTLSGDSFVERGNTERPGVKVRTVLGSVFNTVGGAEVPTRPREEVQSRGNNITRVYPALHYRPGLPLST